MPASDGKAHVRFELVEARLPVSLRGVHRDVGVLHELAAVGRADVRGDADRRLRDD